jgi:hypothetical protein
MKKLLAAIMVLGLSFGVSSAYAAPAWMQSNHPNVVHNGPDYGNDSGSVQ